jgi:hypothetical protein
MGAVHETLADHTMDDFNRPPDDRQATIPFSGGHTNCNPELSLLQFFLPAHASRWNIVALSLLMVLPYLQA